MLEQQHRKQHYKEKIQAGQMYLKAQSILVEIRLRAG